MSTASKNSNLIGLLLVVSVLAACGRVRTGTLNSGPANSYYLYEDGHTCMLNGKTIQSHKERITVSGGQYLLYGDACTTEPVAAIDPKGIDTSGMGYRLVYNGKVFGKGLLVSPLKPSR